MCIGDSMQTCRQGGWLLFYTVYIVEYGSLSATYLHGPGMFNSTD